MNLMRCRTQPQLLSWLVFSLSLSLAACGGSGEKSSSSSSPTSSRASSSSVVSSSSAVSSSSVSSSSLESSSSVETSSASNVSSSLPVASSSVSSESSSVSSSAAVTISGSLTYDFVPHNLNDIGLNYGATESRPMRGVSVELVNSSGQVVAETRSSPTGTYSFTNVAANTQFRVRLKAELVRTQVPTWNISVTDNTSDDALYVAQGGLVSSGSSDSVRDLHAPSGWGGSSYTSARTAAPFAILDSVYTGLTRLQAAGLNQNLPSLEFRWSPNNVPASGDLENGEIGTSFYFNNNIYLLGAADSDPDEYDVHIVLHEWTHYLEDVLFRADSIGGGHSGDDRLDLRVAFSEGLGNSMAGILLDDPVYRDVSGPSQSQGFAYDISTSHPTNRGWYSEASVEVLIYNYYALGGQTLNDILQSLTANTYRTTPALISIYPFVQQLKATSPARVTQINNLLVAQSIATDADIYGSGETNNGGVAANLPIYKNLTPGGGAVNVCSSAVNGKYNGLGVSSFLRFTVASAGTFTVSVQKSGGADVATDPDFELFRRGALVKHAFGEVPNSETDSLHLSPNDYVLEVYDWNNRDPDNADLNTTCFDVSVGQ